MKNSTFVLILLILFLCQKYCCSVFLIKYLKKYHKVIILYPTFYTLLSKKKYKFIDKKKAIEKFGLI